MLSFQSFFCPVCICCGSFFSEENLFCSRCYSLVIKPKLLDSTEGSAIPDHIYLFDWKKGEEETFAQLVYRLKAAQAPEAVKFYSTHLAEKIKVELDLHHYAGLVPVPGSSIFRIHSRLISECLAAQLGLKIYDVLERSSGTKQHKHMNAEERRLSNPFALKENLPEEITAFVQAGRSFIFVDDVLTTGQSIKHCESSLNTAKPNAVATLFYRPSG